MVSIAYLLQNQSREIVSLIFDHQQQLAWERIKETHQMLAPLEEELRVCENIPVGRVMGKERMEPAELPG
jgi:hypothetical protein